MLREATRQDGGVSAPPFLVACEGPVIVAGNAFNLHEDLDLARAEYGDLPIIAVNGASGEIRADHLYSKHPEQFIAQHNWIARQRRFHDDFTVHGSKFHPNMNWVEHWWEGARGGGGSAWGARKVASLMGFDMVILCGAPLDPGGYASDPLSKLMKYQSTMDNFHREIEAEPEWHKGAKSMSGWTKAFLG